MNVLLSCLRRALVVLLLAGFGVVLAQVPANACKCVPAGVAAHAKQVDVVFTGEVTGASTKTVQRGKRELRVRVYSVTVDRLYQGKTEEKVNVVSAVDTTACGLGKIPAGQRWLFFVNGKGPTYYANSCGGSELVVSQSLRQVEKVLGAGEPLATPPPERPPLAFTDDDVSDPMPLGRLVAPGAAVALLGLLGLALVRRKRVA